MKRVVIGPVISPPKLTRYQHLSNEAQLTLAALELKYDRLLQNVQKQETPNGETSGIILTVKTILCVNLSGFILY